MKRTRKAWINGLFLIVTLIINTLGAMGMINGLSQREISDMYVTLITPSPSTFSIWGIIYSLLFISVIGMIVKKNDSYYQKAVDAISSLFRLSCLFNIAWVISFSYIFIELSVLFIFAFLITLTFICLKLLTIQDGKRWLLPLSFGIYTGWLFIASVVNVGTMLVKWEWNGFGIADDIWASVILVIAILLLIFVLSQLRNAAFPLPVAWAYFGIHQFLLAREGFNGQFPLPQTIALAGSAILLILIIIQFYRNRFSILPIAKKF